MSSHIFTVTAIKSVDWEGSESAPVLVTFDKENAIAVAKEYIANNECLIAREYVDSLTVEVHSNVVGLVNSTEFVWSSRESHWSERNVASKNLTFALNLEVSLLNHFQERSVVTNQSKVIKPTLGWVSDISPLLESVEEFHLSQFAIEPYLSRLSFVPTESVVEQGIVKLLDEAMIVEDANSAANEEAIYLFEAYERVCA